MVHHLIVDPAIFRLQGAAGIDTLDFVSQGSLTPQDETSVDSGDSGTDDVIESLVTRVGELEAFLIGMGILEEPPAEP